jgi:hypothetical protein
VNWEAIGAVGEVLGAAGVIISLLYLAVQIRGDARAKRASAVHEQSDAYRDFLRMMASDKELAAIYLCGLRDFGAIKDAELVRFGSALGCLFRVFEEAFFQRKEGHLDEQLWNGFEAPMADMLAYPGAREWWSTRSHWYSKPFQELIASKISESGAPALYGEAAAKGLQRTTDRLGVP